VIHLPAGTKIWLAEARLICVAAFDMKLIRERYVNRILAYGLDGVRLER